MSFTFRNYGTFTGPNAISGDYNYDTVSEETFWHTDLPIDTSFKLTDIAVVFFRDSSDYVGFYLNAINTNLVTLGKNTGSIPVFVGNISNTIMNGNIIANGNITANGVINANGVIKETGITGPTISDLRTQISSKKGFDIPHPSKENHRLRYICVEGPSAEVYLRGKLKNNNVIELPDYWKDLIDAETIGVTLTPIGVYQELFVEKIEWGKRIIVKNNLGGPINCNFVIFAERKDTEKNIPEYRGLTPADYPGDNSEYNINGL